MTETQYLQRPEGRIAYDVRGSGPLVIAAPGMGDTRTVYTAFADDLAALAEHLGATADAPVVLVGNSMSAGSAVLVAAERPGLVSALVLVGPFVRDGEVPVLQRWAFRLLMLPPWSSAAWLAYVPTLYAGGRPPGLSEHLAEVRESLRRPGAARAFRATTRTTQSRAEAALPSVTSAALVVMGDSDPDFSDPAREAAWIAENLGRDAVARPATEVAMIEKAGHYPQAQHPAAVASFVSAFLARTATDA